MKGIKRLDKHSWSDFGLTIRSKNIGNPSKRKITEQVPFSNTVVDFSEIYGAQVYGERELTYTFNLYASTKMEMNIRKIEVINWIMEGQKEPLVDDAIPGFFFMAEAQAAPDFSENGPRGELTVRFTAYPFKISEFEEGNDIWDVFNFLLDMAQITEFNVSGTAAVTLWNNGATDVTPTIVASAPFTITMGGKSYSIPIGTTYSHQFQLPIGENRLTLSGTGSISFYFKKELI